MSKTNTHETDWLKLLFQNEGHANIGDATGLRPSTVAGNLYVALCTGLLAPEDLTEANYTGYARVGIARSAAGWTVGNNFAFNAAETIFNVSAGVPNTITHFGIYTAAVGGDLVALTALGASVNIEIGDTPRFLSGKIIISEN